MAITRTNVAAYLHAEMDSLAAAIGQAGSDDTATGYGPDIDNALRQLGTAESALATAEVDDGLREEYFALAEYYTLRRAWRKMGNRFTHQADDVRVDYKDQLANVKAMLDKAAQRCAVLGYSVDEQTTKTGVFRVY